MLTDTWSHAVAGSGKSNTLVHMVHRTLFEIPDARVLLLQFNHEACRQMKQRLHMHRDRVQVHTLHSLALQLIGPVDVDVEKMFKLWLRFGRPVTDWFKVSRIIDTHRHSSWYPDHSPRPFSMEQSLLEDDLSRRDAVDQEGALYHALYYDRRVMDPYDLVLVDEAQTQGRSNERNTSASRPERCQPPISTSMCRPPWFTYGGLCGGRSGAGHLSISWGQCTFFDPTMLP